MADLKVEKVDSAAHEKFLSENPPADPYSLQPLLNAYKDVFSCDIEYIQIVRNETPVASCALFSRKMFLQQLVKLMPIRAYDGVHFRSLEDSKIQKQEYDRLMALQVFEEYLRENFGFYQLVFQPGVVDIRPFQWAGATVVPQYTYILNLETFSRDNYTKSLREVLRSAERAGLTEGKCSVGELISLNTLSYERHGRRPPVANGALNSILLKLEEAGLLGLTCVKNRDGEIIAGLASLRMRSGSYLYVSGTDARAEKGASHLLYDCMLASEKEAGRSFVDFVGANTPTINLFKSSFGPRLETYFKVWRANSFTARVGARIKNI